MMRGIILFSERVRPRIKHQWICNTCQRTFSSSSPSRTATSKLSPGQNLPDTAARTRFAPSPTGSLHLGSLRTALFNYLLAKSTGGQFILRIEDTDQKRTVPGAEDGIYRDLEWAGLEWDEGPMKGGPHGPYKQSERTATYHKHAENLLGSGHAYRCFCSAERLQTLAKHRHGLGLPADYDRACASVSAEESADRATKGEAHVIRFKAPEVYPVFDDLIYKRVKNRPPRGPKAELYPAFEDPILLKTDGFPTYHLANVVDDHEMRITHVVRGSEWMSSTPKHLAMYEAFSWQPPKFAHVGLLTDENYQKLSKRNLDIDVSAFRDKMGIFPETLTNFVALLGWSHSQKKDIMSLEQLIQNFSMKFTKGNTVVTFDKMWYLQRAHAARYAAASVEDPDFPQMGLMLDPIMDILREKALLGDSDLVLNIHEPRSYVSDLVRADARNYKTANEFVERNKYFFETPDRITLHKSAPALEIPFDELEQAVSSLGEISEHQWKAPSIRDAINGTAGTKPSKEIHDFIRWGLSAGRPGPSGGDTMELLGRLEVLSRLDVALEILEELGSVEEVNS